MKKYSLGIDIGGTKMEICFLPIEADIDVSHIVGRSRTHTERDQGYEHALDNLSQLILSELNKLGLHKDQISSVGIGLPGTVDPISGYMVHGNSQIFENRDLKLDLAKKLNFSCPFFTENDANCFTLAEIKLGVGKKYYRENPSKSQMAVGVILGTGCGGAIVVNGAVLSGKNGGGEIGHLTLDPAGPTCYCGLNGCAESFISGSGLERLYQDKFSEKKKASTIFSEYKKNEQSDWALETYKRYLELFLISVTNALDPDFFVLGGGVSQQDLIYQDLEENLRKKCFYPNTQVRVYKHLLGDSAGVIGAALLGL
jgi:fructokinase